MLIEKNNNGITLIVLIITIVLLLILTTVSVNMVINKDLLKQADGAVKETGNKIEDAKKDTNEILQQNQNLDVTLPVENTDIEDLTISVVIKNKEEQYLVGDLIYYTITISNKLNVDLSNVNILVVLGNATGNVKFTNLNGAKETATNTIHFDSLGAGEVKNIECEYLVAREDSGKSITMKAGMIADSIKYNETESLDINKMSNEVGPVNIEKLYKLTVKYVYSGSLETAAPDFVANHLSGEEFTYTSPDIDGYEPDSPIIKGKILDDTVITVTYSSVQT